MTSDEWLDVMNRYADRLPYKGLVALQKAIRENDPELGHSYCGVWPPPEPHCAHNPVSYADLVGYAIWKSEITDGTVREVWMHWDKIFKAVDSEVGSARNIDFWRYYDRTPREQMKRELVLWLGYYIEERQ